MNNEKIIEYKKYIIKKLDEFTNVLTSIIMEKENVVNGDIFPEQAFELEECYETIASVLLEAVEQNKGE